MPIRTRGGGGTKSNNPAELASSFFTRLLLPQTAHILISPRRLGGFHLPLPPGHGGPGRDQAGLEHPSRGRLRLSAAVGAVPVPLGALWRLPGAPRSARRPGRPAEGAGPEPRPRFRPRRAAPATSRPLAGAGLAGARSREPPSAAGMLQKREKVLLLRTFQGRTLRIVREHYLRPSVPCNSPLCPQPAACRNGQGRAAARRAGRGGSEGGGAGPGVRREAPGRCWRRSAGSRRGRGRGRGASARPGRSSGRLRGCGRGARGPRPQRRPDGRGARLPGAVHTRPPDGPPLKRKGPESGALRGARGRRNLPLLHPGGIVWW